MHNRKQPFSLETIAENESGVKKEKSKSIYSSSFSNVSADPNQRLVDEIKKAIYIYQAPSAVLSVTTLDSNDVDKVCLLMKETTLNNLESNRKEIDTLFRHLKEPFEKLAGARKILHADGSLSQAKSETVRLLENLENVMMSRLYKVVAVRMIDDFQKIKNSIEENLASQLKILEQDRQDKIALFIQEVSKDFDEIKKIDIPALCIKKIDALHKKMVAERNAINNKGPFLDDELFVKIFTNMLNKLSKVLDLTQAIKYLNHQANKAKEISANPVHIGSLFSSQTQKPVSGVQVDSVKIKIAWPESTQPDPKQATPRKK